LKIVRRTVEEGKPVVFFRVEVADNRRTQIKDVEKVVGDSSEGPFEGFHITYFNSNMAPVSTIAASPVKASLGLLEPTSNFWAPSQSSPLLDPSKGRREFGVLVPTNAAIWKLRVTVDMESPNPSERFKSSLIVWRLMRKRGSSVYEATKASWRIFTVMGSEAVESDLITNAIPRL
jgi:hypothetical protein